MIEEMWRVLYAPGGLLFARLATSIGLEGGYVAATTGRRPGCQTAQSASWSTSRRFSARSWDRW